MTSCSSGPRSIACGSHNSQQPSLNATCQSEDVGDLALALAQFEKLVNDASVVPVYQPIVNARRTRSSPRKR